MASSRSHHRNGAASSSPVAVVLAPAAEKLREVTQQVKAQGQRLIARQKRRAAEELRTVGTSIRHAATQLREGPLEGVGRYVVAAADGGTRASRHLEERDVDALVVEAEQICRRRPTWFLAGMFVAGFVLARVLKVNAAPPLRRAPARRRTAGRRAGR
jgi:hypothetical protein